MGSTKVWSISHSRMGNATHAIENVHLFLAQNFYFFRNDLTITWSYLFIYLFIAKCKIKNQGNWENIFK